MVSTALKRAALDDAWDATGDDQNQSLRDTLRQFESAARRNIAGGSLASVGANSRTSAFSSYGAGQITPVEVCEMWRDLIDRHDQSKLWLQSCAALSLDPVQTEIVGWPFGTPTPSNLPSVTDDKVYAWMMTHLVAITEARSDYSKLRTGGGMQWA